MAKRYSPITVVGLTGLILFLAKTSIAGVCLNGSCHHELTTTKHIHGPVAAEMAGADGCQACHTSTGKSCSTTRAGKFTFEKGEKEMCLLCHSDEVATKHTSSQKGCLRCHDPHGSDTSSYLLRPKELKK